jgi:hypothetical protein
VDGKRLPCQSVVSGRDTVAGEVYFTFVQLSRPGVPTNGLHFNTERQGVEISERRLVYRLIRVVGGIYPANLRYLGNGRGRCILDVSSFNMYGIVWQSCTFTLTNGQTVSAEATYEGIKGDFGPD